MPAVLLHGRRPDISSLGSQRPQPTCQPLMSVSLMFQGQLKKAIVTVLRLLVGIQGKCLVYISSHTT